MLVSTDKVYSELGMEAVNEWFGAVMALSGEMDSAAEEIFDEAAAEDGAGVPVGDIGSELELVGASVIKREVGAAEEGAEVPVGDIGSEIGAVGVPVIKREVGAAEEMSIVSVNVVDLYSLVEIPEVRDGSFVSVELIGKSAVKDKAKILEGVGLVCNSKPLLLN